MAAAWQYHIVSALVSRFYHITSTPAHQRTVLHQWDTTRAPGGGRGGPHSFLSPSKKATSCPTGTFLTPPPVTIFPFPFPLSTSFDCFLRIRGSTNLPPENTPPASFSLLSCLPLLMPNPKRSVDWERRRLAGGDEEAGRLESTEGDGEMYAD